MARREYAGAAPPTTTFGVIAAVDTTFTVAAGANYPTGAVGPFFVILDAGLAAEEKILCLSRSGNSFTVAGGGRGAAGTAAASHASGATCAHVFTNVDADEANAHVNATTGVHGVTGAVVGVTDTQTLTNKTLTAPTINNPVIIGYTPPALAKTYRMVHTFTISGVIAVAAGDTSYIPPFFVSLPAGQTATIVGARHRVHLGTSATFTVSHGAADAGTSVTGLTGIAATTTTTFTAATAANGLADGDAVQLVVTGINGTPQNMTVSVYLDVTV